MRNKKITMKKIFFVLLLLPSFLFAQPYIVLKGDTINRKDANGKQGIWKKYYRTDKLFSETVFKNDKQTGVTKFYYESGKPQSELTWTVDGVKANAVDYYESGKTKATGFYIHQKKVLQTSL